jgi:pseudaminic acid synthase
MKKQLNEKNIYTLKNQKKGHDIKFSAKGSDIKKYKDELIKTSKLFEKYSFFRSKKEMKNIIFRRSIFARINIKKDEIFTEKNIYTLRPNIGLAANYYPFILGKKSPIIIKKNSVLKKSILSNLKKNNILNT